jgi:hypothetical protein
LGIARCAIHLRECFVVSLQEADAFRIETNLDSFTFDDLVNGRGNVVFAPNESRSHLDDGNFAPETAEHLPELEPDVAATDNDQMLGHEVDFHERAIVEKFDLLETRHRRDEGASAHVDENPIRCESVVANADLAGGFEARVSCDNCAVVHLFQPGLTPQRDSCTMASFRAFTRGMSTPTSPPMFTPNSVARLARWAA